MKVKLTRKETAPPNLAAKSLRLGQFQPKVAEHPKAYNRKVKHRKGSVIDGQLPFAVSTPDAAPQDTDTHPDTEA